MTSPLLASSALVLLSIQSCLYMLAVRISKTQNGSVYNTAVLIAVGESLKAIVSMVSNNPARSHSFVHFAFWMDEHRPSRMQVLLILTDEISEYAREGPNIYWGAWKVFRTTLPGMSVPAIVYAFQSQFIIMSGR